MKKITLFIFSLVISFVLFCGLSAQADGTLTMVDGAQIRTEGEFQGLRFQASASSLDGTDEHGFYLAAGEHSLSDMRTAIEAGEATVGGRKLVKRSTTGEDLEFAVTIYGMDETSEYAQVITAVAYVKTGASFTFDKAVTRNIAEGVRELYNASETPAEIVATVAEATRVKVTGSDSSVAYYADTNAVTLAAGDTLDLLRGDYTNALTIDKDSVTINGAQKDVSTGKSTSSRGLETTLTKALTIEDGVSDTTVNGLKFTGTNALVLNGSVSELEFKNNMCNWSGNYGIKDSAADFSAVAHSDLNFHDNTFYGTNASYQRAFYVQGNIDGVQIKDNLLKDKLATINTSEYAIRFDRISDDGSLLIMGNDFRYYGANYLIDLCYAHSESSNTVNVTIEDNTMSSGSSTFLQGNGIRVYYLKTGSTVNILHNIRFATSAYYNAILLTDGNAANSANGQKPTINIKYNKFYATNDVEIVAKPEKRSDVGSKFTRIGLGVDADATINLDANYFANSTSRAAYTSPESASAYSNTNQIVLTTNKAAAHGDADTAYEAYVASK